MPRYKAGGLCHFIYFYDIIYYTKIYGTISIEPHEGGV